jgi:hypothetical protein
MIADCAIEPEVFATWRHFQSLYEDFGVPRGRLISKFPGKWIKKVADHSRELVKHGVNTEIQAAKIEERLRSERFKRKFHEQGGRKYDPEQSWIDNAEEAEPPFDLIICSGSTTSGNRIGAEVLLKDEAPFARSSQGQIVRKKENLISVAKPLVCFAEHIVIIDPNFRADEPRFCDSLKHLISLMESSGRTPKRFEVHTNRVRKAGETFNRGPHVSQWEHHLMPHLPKNWQLTVCYWERLPNGGKPHARFLLTEMGGFYFDHGIDEGDGETLVTLLEETVWEPLFALYDSRALPATFDVAQHVIHVKG